MQKKALFLGDSFTVGTGLGPGREQEAFPFQLINRLRQDGISAADPKMYAVDGDTTKHLLGALNHAEPQSNPDHKADKVGDFDLVVLSIGVNDLFRGHSLDDYKHHFKELLDRAIRLAGDDPSRVVVLSIPAWDASPSVHSGDGPNFRASKYAEVRRHIAGDSYYNTQGGTAKSIDTFNRAAWEAIQEINTKNGGRKTVALVDLTDLTRKDATLPDGTPDKTLFADDGIHYSGKMYAQWVEKAFPITKNAMLGINNAAGKPKHP